MIERSPKLPLSLEISVHVQAAGISKWRNWS
jgi:hypothetical protein